MNKDDKQLVRNMIIFCVIFSLLFTVYRIIYLLSDNEIPEKSDIAIHEETAEPKNDNLSHSYEDGGLFNGTASIADPLENMNVLLFEAALKGDFEAVRRYIDMGANPNAKDTDGNSAINAIAAKNNPDMDMMNCFRYLLIKGADANFQNNDGSTPLISHFAAGCFNKAVLDVLFQYGADADRKNYDGLSAMFYAVSGGNLQGAEYLLSKGADINLKDSRSETALHYATRNSEYDIVTFLLNNGADKNIYNDSGKSPLDMAKESNDEKMFAIYGITRADAEKDKKKSALKNLIINNRGKAAMAEIEQAVLSGNLDMEITKDDTAAIYNKFVGARATPLIASIYFGYDDIAKALIDNGADVNKCDGYPKLSPLMIAASMDNADMAAYLLKNGADISYISDVAGTSAISYAGLPKTAKLLLDAGSSPNFEEGDTCVSLLQNAVIHNNYELAKILIDYGADVNHADCVNFKPIIANAVDTGNPSLIRLLLDNGAGVKTEVGKDLSVTLIDYAKSKGSAEIIKMISEKLGTDNEDAIQSGDNIPAGKTETEKKETNNAVNTKPAPVKPDENKAPPQTSDNFSERLQNFRDNAAAGNIAAKDNNITSNQTKEPEQPARNQEIDDIMNKLVNEL